MVLSDNSYLQDGKYRIIRVLGQGGFGITYLAEHTFLDKLVAIKEFFPKEYCERDESTSHVTIGLKNSSELVETLKAKFLKEAKNISKLDHPGIVKIFDIFQENGTAYYIMEYVEGESLSSKIKRDGAMSEGDAISILRKVASAIEHIHGLSMNHLDIKPANIMIRAKDGEPILIDFGLSKQYDAAGSQTSTTPVGISHGYAPIEQYIPGGVSSFSPQTDIYALGATLYAMLTGKTPPHYGEILENGIPEYPSSVSDTIKDAIEHALETKKQKRPQTIAQFLAHFDGFMVESPSKQDVTLSQSVDYIENEIQPKIAVEIEQSSNPIIEEGKPSPESISEETVMTSPISDVADSNAKVNNVCEKEESTELLQTEPISLTEEEYVDLGLSVRWASEFIGFATPSTEGGSTYTYLLENGVELSEEEFQALGYRLPTIRDVEELMDKCEYSFSMAERMFKFIGKKGQIIKLPFSAIDEIVLKESSEPDMGGFVYLFHVNKGDHHLHKSKPCVANIWTVKE